MNPKNQLRAGTPRSKQQIYRKKLIKKLYESGNSIIPLNREEQDEATVFEGRNLELFIF